MCRPWSACFTGTCMLVLCCKSHVCSTCIACPLSTCPEYNCHCLACLICSTPTAFLQCVCQCPTGFDAGAPAPSMASNSEPVYVPSTADMLDSLSGMMGSGCGPEPTQYEPYLQVSTAKIFTWPSLYSSCMYTFSNM